MPTSKIETKTVYQVTFQNIYTEKNDFKGINGSPTKSEKIDRPLTVSAPFSGISSYQNMFLNWGLSDKPELIP